jgi:hypothetical protein
MSSKEIQANAKIELERGLYENTHAKLMKSELELEEAKKELSKLKEAKEEQAGKIRR